MDIVTIDFETYYDKDYSLSKMTTEAYVRDPRFQVTGLAVKVNDHPTDWYSGDNPGRFLKSLNYSDKAILCHNTAFDGAILSWLFGIKPKFWLDTLSMARPHHAITTGLSLKNLAAHYKLGEKGTEVLKSLGKRREDFTPEEMNRYAEYGINDVELTYKLFKKLRKLTTAEELRIIDITMRMYTEPTIQLDRALLEQHLVDVIERKSNLVDVLGLDCSEEEAKRILMSNDKFAKFLSDMGVQPPRKTSPRTGKETWAFGKTDKEFTALAEHPDPVVQAAVAARLGVKSTLEQTRTENLIKVSERGPLPIMLHYYGAHTGRFSGGDKLNLQNLPRGGALRKSLAVPKGKVLIACDSAQIEARMVAWLSDQEDLLQAFREGRDVYSEFASEVYSKKVTKADKVERFVGKTCVLGLGYGMGAQKFKDTLALGQGGIKVDVDIDEASRIVTLYRGKNHKIAAMWRRGGNVLVDMLAGRDGLIMPSRNLLPYSYATGITLPSGLPILYPLLSTEASGLGLQYVNDARAYRTAVVNKLGGDTQKGVPWTRIYGGKVVENIVQALARIVVAHQMVEIAKRYKVVLQVHDEIVCCVDEGEAEEAKQFIMDCMSTPPEWAADLPVACEADIGLNYGECK